MVFLNFHKLRKKAKKRANAIFEEDGMDADTYAGLMTCGLVLALCVTYLIWIKYIH